MKKIFFFLSLLICLSASAQWSLSGTKVREGYGRAWSTKDSTAFTSPGDSLVLAMGSDSLFHYKYKGYWQTLSIGVPNTYVKYADTAGIFGRYFTGGILKGASFPALTGDITTSLGSLITTLKSIGTPGTYGSVSAVPIFVTDYAGRVTSVTNTAINIVESQVTNLVSDLASKLNLSGGTMTGFLTLNADPTNPLHAATKNYVDQLFVGLSWKKSVRVATDANIILSGTQTIHGYALQIGDRVLVKAQTDQTTNGIYVVAAGVWTRGANENTGPSLVSAAVLIDTVDNVLRSQQWANNNPSITLGTTNITFIQTGGPGSYVAGLGLTLTGNVFAINTSIVPQLGVANTFTGNNTFSGSNIFSSSLYATGNTSSVILGNSNGSPELVFNSQTGNITTAYANYDRGLGFHIWQAGFDVNNNYLVRRYVSGTFTDNPISISYSTGNVTFADIPSGVSTNPFLVSNAGVISSLTTAQAQSALGLTTFNWVDIPSNQTITGAKTFSAGATFNSNIYANNSIYLSTGFMNISDVTANNGFIQFSRGGVIKSVTGSLANSYLYADTSGGLLWSMYSRSLATDSRSIFLSNNTLPRFYTFPNNSGTVALISDLTSGYLPINNPTFTGTLTGPYLTLNNSGQVGKAQNLISSTTETYFTFYDSTGDYTHFGESTVNNKYGFVVSNRNFRIYTKANQLAATFDSLKNVTVGADLLLYGSSASFTGDITANNTANRVYTLPDKNGTFAMLTDINAGSGASFTENGNTATSYAVYLKRFTDASPAGYLIQGQNAAGNANLFTVDVAGNIVGAGNITASGTITGSLPALGTTPSNFLTGASGQINNVTIAQAQTALGITGGPFLPLSAGSGMPLTGGLYSGNSSTGAYGVIFSYLSTQANSRSWFIDNDRIAYGDFAIQQSTTQTGITWQNALYIDPSRNVTLYGNLTTSGNSVTGGAASFTTGAFSGVITSTNTGSLFNSLSATTQAAYSHLSSTGADFYYGIDNSVGNALLSGGVAYSAVLRSSAGIALSGAGSSGVGIFLNTSNNVGIGTTSPNLTAVNRTVLDINGSASSILSLSSGTTSGGYIYVDNTQFQIVSSGRNMVFYPSGITALTLSGSNQAATFSSSVTATSFIKSGGTSSQILAADGSSITAGTGITISGGTISSSGTGVVPTVGNKAVLAQTTTQTLFTYVVGGTDRTFVFGGNLNLTAISSGSVAIAINYTRQDGTASTTYLYNQNAAGYYVSFPLPLRIKASTTVTVAITTPIAATGYTYDANAYMQDMGY